MCVNEGSRNRCTTTTTKTATDWSQPTLMDCSRKKKKADVPAKRDSRRHEREEEKEEIHSEARLEEVGVEDGVGDGLEHVANVVGVRGTGDVGVEAGQGIVLGADVGGGETMLGGQGDELVADETHRVRVAVAAVVVRKTALERLYANALAEDVALVEEEYDAAALKPATVGHLVEEFERFVHAVHLFVLVQLLIVAAESHTEEHRCDTLEAVNPLHAFAALSAHIDHAELCATALKGEIHDTCGT
mmetsp:Transcript_41502/g.104674  ORF Transcript_41502/g.104674 Transcript_41502/m.104674 type:complete len:246 (+) Transcript_41502:247-984(+)